MIYPRHFAFIFIEQIRYHMSKNDGVKCHTLNFDQLVSRKQLLALQK